jgi:Fic family protein
MGKNMKNPPFEITQAMLADVAEISELVGRLSASKHSASPILRRTNRIRTIQGTLAIEQNTLSVEQVTAVLNGKHVLAPPRDIAEVRNAYTVYDTIEELDPYSVDSLLSAHGIMMRGLIDESGMFRSRAVGVVDSQGNILHMGTLPRYVPNSVEQLFSWVRDSDLPMVIKSSVFHYEFELIHPFADGNGRMGRLWHTRLLMEWDPLFAWLPVESIIHDRQQQYYDVINASNNAGESTVFIEFMLSAIKAALFEASGMKKPLGKNAQNAALRRQFVLDHLAGHPLIHNADLCDGLGVSPATANRILRELCEDGTLERMRDGKVWGYKKGILGNENI